MCRWADLARVTAGFANEVDEVNQYAAVMYKPTAYGTRACIEPKRRQR